jgi:hypothetical protein
MKLPTICYITFAIFIFSNCKNSITNPTINQKTTLPDSVLIESNFEDQGQPSLSGWHDNWKYHIFQKSSYSFSHDVPKDGGNWSLKINHPNTLRSEMYIYFKPIKPSQMKTYRIIYSYKSSTIPSNYEIALNAYSDGLSSHWWFDGGNSTTWTQDTIMVHPGKYSIDSLRADITMLPMDDTTKYVLFDNIKVEEY